MGGFGGKGAVCLFARLVGLAAGCLALANCSSGVTGRVDPRYGVSASARAVAMGEPVPKGGGVYRVGRPYVVGGREYVPQENVNYSAVGMASWYGDDFHGRYTANGEIFDMNSLSAAHPTLPLPSYVRVTNLTNHKSLVVRVNDRGPYVGDRLIDVSVRTARLLGFYGNGLTKVKVEYVGRAPLEGSDDRKLAATLREPGSDSPMLVASSGPFAPTFFSNRPMSRTVDSVPAPPDRPYRLGEGAREVPAVQDPAAQTVELAAAARPEPPVARAALTSPVSAYAPPRYDSRAGLLSGRGLY
ncbi:MAG TPA: septal ring lytic transglycosylase RlpA family protein [Pseudolabrys sp.]|jgi:rare lipoprotein A